MKALLQVLMRLQLPWFLGCLKRGWLDSHCLLGSVRCLVQSTSVVLVLPVVLLLLGWGAPGAHTAGVAFQPFRS